MQAGRLKEAAARRLVERLRRVADLQVGSRLCSPSFVHARTHTRRLVRVCTKTCAHTRTRTHTQTQTQTHGHANAHAHAHARTRPRHTGGGGVE